MKHGMSCGRCTFASMELEINVFFMLVDVEYHVKGNCCAVCHTTTILMALRSCKQHLCCPGCRVRRYLSKVKYTDDMSQVLPRLSIVDMLPHVRDVCRTFHRQFIRQFQ